jgi:hypothetical protein
MAAPPDDTSRPDDKLINDLVDAYVVRHTVHFAHNHDQGAVPGGSGVLARAGKVGGILTCRHVVADIAQRAKRKPDGILGLCANGSRSTTLQSTAMTLAEFKALPIIAFKSAKEAEQDASLGPDIAFVKLPENKMAALEALGTAVDLTVQSRLAGTPSDKRGSLLSIATGVIAEGQECAFEKNSAILVPFATSVISGEVTPMAASEYFDRLCFKPTRKETAYPSSFGGLSGGGVWQLLLDHDEAGAMKVSERRLVGVAYYQTATDDAGYRDIIGHGPGSIYQRLLPEIEQMSVKADVSR